MVIDTSALIAILLAEPENEIFSRLISEAPKRLIGSFNALETGIAIEAKKGDAGGREFDLLMHRAEMEIVAMDSRQFEIARRAWRVYGEGRHPASLNIGDCCAYALAKYAGEKLLYKGEHFSKTDISPVWRKPD